jgi:hypothetical protein
MPLRIRQLEDFGGSPLNKSKNKFVMDYEFNNNKFNLISADNVEELAVSDFDIPDPFIEQLEKELDIDNIQLRTLDGGNF